MATALTRYRNQNSFTLMLTRIGCGRNESERLVNDGINTMQAVVNLYTYNTKGFKTHLNFLNKSFGNNVANPVYFTPIVITRLLGILYHFDQAVHTFHSVPEINHINAARADELSRFYSDSILLNDDDDDLDVKVPKLEGNTNWRAFKDKFVLKLSTMYGTRHIPLDYVVDQTVRGVNNGRASLTINADIDVYDSSFIKNQAVLFGPHYKEDNKKVMLLLKRLLLNTPSYNHILDSADRNDGRAAFNALVQYYEGEDYVERNISTAFDKLSSTFYRGDTIRYNFEKYVAAHMECHRLLHEARYNNGSGMDDATKIQHLKSGIKEEAGLEHAITTARTNGLAQGDFHSYVNFLSTEVENRNNRKQQLKSKERTIRGVGRGGFRGGGRAGRGRGRSNNHNNSNQDLGPVLTAYVDGKQVESKKYTQSEFSNLTGRQRAKVIELNRKRRENARSNHANHPNLSSVNTDALSAALLPAIVAGVTQATRTNAGSDCPTIASTIDSRNMSSHPQGNSAATMAASGSVGEFMSKRRKMNSNSQDQS